MLIVIKHYSPRGVTTKLERIVNLRAVTTIEPIGYDKSRLHMANGKFIYSNDSITSIKRKITAARKEWGKK